MGDKMKDNVKAEAIGNWQLATRVLGALGLIIGYNH
jgi:hypothetical protein